MSNVSLAFLLTTFSGLATMIGTIPCFFKFKNEKKIITASLAFASGVMICVSITDLVPEAIKMLEDYYSSFMTIFLSFIFLFIGIIISVITSKAMPQSLAENENQTLYKVGIISMLAIIIHNLPEGVATYISTTKNTSLGISLAIAISLHNIPEGISISVPIYYATKSKFKAVFYTFISAISEPLGAFITYLFLYKYISNVILGLLFAFIGGIMIQISLSELLPTSTSYNYPKITKVSFIIGVVFMLIKFVL